MISHNNHTGDISETLNVSSSWIDQMWLVNSADIAGVRLSHFLGEPLPFVGIGSGNLRRNPLWGRTKW